MIKVKDGYAKLIGTTYQGSATQVLLSNGGDLEYSASSKASTLVQRNASQHIYATYFNSAISDEALTDIGSVYVRNTSDTFIRRVSKTQFYSILDDKFVTLDTTQSITGAKTFSTSVRFADKASIIQNQSDASNYTTILKWYRNGASRNTYDPSIGQHNIGGDGNGSICILPYPTETIPWGGTVGLFISKGVLKLDGKSVALAENYYTKTESDKRYVNVTGDTMTGPLIVKAAITGTQLISTIATGTSPLTVSSTTVVGNLNADMVDGYHSYKLFRNFGGVSTDFNFSDNNNNNGLYYLHSDYTQSNKNGITYGSLMNFSSSASSWQIISGNDARLYYRNRWWSGGGGAWSAWKTIAYTSDIPSSLKNPYSLTLQTNGSTQTTYDGSSAKTFNVTVQNAGSGLLHNSLTITLANTTTDSGWSMINSSYNGFILKSIRTQASTPSWILDNHSAGICFGGADTKGVISCAYYAPSIRFAGGNGSKPVWWIGITGSSRVTYNLANMWTGTRYWADIAVSTASSTKTKPTFNTCYTSNWFRSTGSTGWYSESYGGGWHMSDSTWLRAYNGKAVYTSNAGSQAFNATGGFYSGGSGGNGLTIIGSESTTTRIKGQIGSSANTAVARYEVQWYSNYARFDVHRGGSTDISKWSFKYNSTEVTYLTTGGHLYANGFHHGSMDSNNYVLLAGGSYKSLADFVKGNAGASNRGVYVTNGTVTAMTYYLNATVNSGESKKLAYYSGTNSIDDYTSTVGSSETPIYLSRGVPTACTGVMIKYWASYMITNYSGTSVGYRKHGGTYNFITSASRRGTGRYTIGTVYPPGQTWYNTLVWAVGNLNASNSSNSSNSLLYCTLIRGYNSGSIYYWYVNTADDASTNNGSFGLFFLSL